MPELFVLGVKLECRLVVLQAWRGQCMTGWIWFNGVHQIIQGTSGQKKCILQHMTNTVTICSLCFYLNPQQGRNTFPLEGAILSKPVEKIPTVNALSHYFLVFHGSVSMELGTELLFTPVYFLPWPTNCSCHFSLGLNRPYIANHEIKWNKIEIK